MPDESSTQTPSKDSSTPDSQSGAKTAEVTPKDIEGKSAEEITKIVAAKAEELGTTKKQVEDLQKWQKEITPYLPYLQTIAGDSELSKVVEKAHNKRMGIAEPEETKAPGEKKEEGTQVPQSDNDLRKKMTNDVIKKFEVDKGIDKLEGKAKEELSQALGHELFDIYDPDNKKTYNQILTEIPLNKLEAAFERAYKSVTFDDKVKQARESGAAVLQSGQTGIIGSMASSSADSSDEITLTPGEQDKARKLNIDPKQYLLRKKQIMERNAKETTK